ncbi:hypothetical protein [Methylobacterium sp. J-070]|uniref:hypothetical protein n=1 Tax=Methylobacterium sp. J-070 TaxID=2836650 RepID=UPI001FBA13DE|nr:hypothetical protein [Methylobacterium sp. J-070]MCJ2048291.1 hypothetical protein [Methylobacterium sp. J-070]
MLNSDTSRTPYLGRSPRPGAAAATDWPPARRDIAGRAAAAPLSVHERAALAGAADDGLMPDEVARILAGRRVAEAFPVRRGESPEAYASRTVSEMFVAYLQ